MREQALTESKIKHLQKSLPLVVDENTPLRLVLQRMRAEKQTCVLICRAAICSGIFTERDYLQRILGKPIDISRPIQEFMTKNPKTLTLEDNLGSAIQLMDEFSYRNIPLCDSAGNSAGLVQIRDIINFLAELYPHEVLNAPPRPDRKFSEPDGA